MVEEGDGGRRPGEGGGSGEKAFERRRNKGVRSKDRVGKGEERVVVERTGDGKADGEVRGLRDAKSDVGRDG